MNGQQTTLEDQIEGLPPGAQLRPIQGLPKGAVLKPVSGGLTTGRNLSNPYQQAAESFANRPNPQQPSMSAGPPKPEQQPSWFQRFMSAAGLPTSQGETTTAVQSLLTPQADPNEQDWLLRQEEKIPLVGADVRARAQLVREGHPAGHIPFLGPAIAQHVESTVGEHPDSATALGSGVNILGQTLGARGVIKPKPLTAALSEFRSPAALAAPRSVEALTGLIEDKAGTVDPHATATEVLPHWRETAVRMGIDPTAMEGRAAGQATLKVAEQAISDVQKEFDTIRKPYNSVLVDQRPIAQAYREAITPELLKNEPRVAAELERQAKKFDQPAPLEQINQFRTRMNRQLNALEQRGTTAQLMSSDMERAHKAAANAARGLEYETVGVVSGLDMEYVRGLKQREGSLIEAKNSLEKEYNRASGAQGEAVSKTFQEKVANTYPSPRGVKHAGLKELLGPKPIDILNSRIQKMFEGMGSAQPLPEYEQVGGPSGPVPAGEDLAEEARRGGPGIQPPTAPSTAETFVRPSRMGTQQGIADQLTAAKSGKSAETTARIEQHARAKKAIGEQVKAPVAPIDLSKLPDYLRESIEQGHKEAMNLGIADQIEELSAQGLTAKEVAYKLKDKFGNTPVGDRNQIIRSTRAARGIPSQDNMQEFEAWRQARAKGLQTPVAPAPVAENGQITAAHVASENAFYTQARAELGADASPSDVLRRAQALKIEHTAAGAPPPVTPVPPTVRPTLTQKVQSQPLPKLRQVTRPAQPSPAAAADETPAQQATSIMLLVKQGRISQAEADSKIKRLIGPGGRRTIRRPVGPE